MTKVNSELRDNLFEKYFEIKDGIFLEDLISILSFVTAIWGKLSEIIANDTHEYKRNERIENIKEINYKENIYLIIKFRFWKYLIINVYENKALKLDEIKEIFDEEFFISYFSEQKLDIENALTDIYWFLNYSGNATEIIKFYDVYKDYLSLPTSINYIIKLADAWTYIYINLINGNIQLGFQNNSKDLYEQIFFNPDLTPFYLQDAYSKMGKQKMNEIFLRIKSIIIPMESIPSSLLDNKDLKTLFTFNNNKTNLINIKKQLLKELDNKYQR